MGVTELNKYSVVKISTDKWRLDGFRLTRQNNRFELGRTEKTNLVSGNGKCLCLQTQDRKNQVSRLMLGNFFIYL